MFRPLLSVLLLCTLAVFTTAEPVCDPETQYLLNGECCQLCKPGTSMVSEGECRNPVCKDCDEGDYMNKYNKEEKCKKQPYCDPNSNFEWPESTSKTEHHLCLCKRGFHCSSASCLTCVPHTECEPGHRATTIGDQNHDTVCEKCPDGTFSDEKSWNGTCKKKTTCPGAVAKDGNSESDDECGNFLFLFLIDCFDRVTSISFGNYLYNYMTLWVIHQF
uniref:CD40 molecule, TNF receptor superfamily member 5 n=1 Tax=Neogobius melanostomus TaxID=47308 RepID=A0A8C6U479_9GOBI